ncbi:helix-turn-helix transcriptional regulator [Microbacterium sp. NPDC078428]|uniref:helix-turn-helix transcriptional regulator n=1 Tax=Microbacterium sp. NPDC078428 TaxID=3364190 RepID=UPI0037C670FC
MTEVISSVEPTLTDINSRPQVSAYTGISVQTLARWAGEGKGPKFVKAGGRVLYRKRDVLAWIDSLEEAS